MLFSQVSTWLTPSPSLSLVEMLLLGEASPDHPFPNCISFLPSFHSLNPLTLFNFFLSEHLSPFNTLYEFIIYYVSPIWNLNWTRAGVFVCPVYCCIPAPRTVTST